MRGVVIEKNKVRVFRLGWGFSLHARVSAAQVQVVVTFFIPLLNRLNLLARGAGNLRGVCRGLQTYAS